MLMPNTTPRRKNRLRLALDSGQRRLAEEVADPDRVDRGGQRLQHVGTQDRQRDNGSVLAIGPSVSVVMRLVGDMESGLRREWEWRRASEPFWMHGAQGEATAVGHPVGNLRR
jgi:hypothetical protein